MRQLGLYEITEAWVPCGDNFNRTSLESWVSFPGPRMTLNDESENLIRQIPRLFDTFKRLPNEIRRALQLSTHRLNSAFTSRSTVDRAIDLGIAFESLFLHEQNPEHRDIGLSLRLRAARYLETDAATRRKLTIIISDLYTLRSSAVHSGAISPTTLKRLKTKWSAERVLREASAILARGSRQIIMNGGFPDWDGVIFN